MWEKPRAGARHTGRAQEALVMILVPPGMAPCLSCLAFIPPTRSFEPSEGSSMLVWASAGEDSQ